MFFIHVTGWIKKVLIETSTFKGIQCENSKVIVNVSTDTIKIRMVFDEESFELS